MALIIPSSVGGNINIEPVNTVTKTIVELEKPNTLIVPDRVSGKAVQVKEPQKETGFVKGISDFFTGDDRETRATRDLPELGKGGLLSGEDPLTIAKVSPILLTATNPAEIGRILSSSFENVRIQEDEKGNLIAANNKTGQRVIINKPGLSQLDILQGLGVAATFFPAAKIAGAIPAGARLTSGAIAKQAAKGAATAGATEALLQSGQKSLGGEFDTADIALSAGLGAGAEVIAPLARKFTDAVKSRKDLINVEDVAQAKTSIDTAEQAQKGIKKATGIEIPLFQGQKTQIPSTLDDQAFVTTLSAGSEKASRKIKIQNKSVDNAVSKLLDSIASRDAIVSGSTKVRNAAQKSLVDAKKSVRDKVSPLYAKASKDAAESGKVINLKPLNDFIRLELKNLVDDDPATIALKSFMNRIKPQKTKVPEASTILDAQGNKIVKTKASQLPISLERLQSAKLTTDAKIDSMAGITPNSATKNAKRLLTEAVKIYRNQIGEVSEGFIQANKKFAELMKPVDALENSIVGKISKIKDTELRTLSGKLFNPAETNPTIMLQAKSEIKKQDKQAWNEIVRTELEKRLGKVNVSDISTTSENVPLKLKNAIFGNSVQTRLLLNALDGDVKKNFLLLETVLNRASLGRAGGSQTATREARKAELSRGLIRVIIDTVASPVNAISGVGKEGSFNAAVRKLTKAVFDEKWKPRMSAIRKMNPKTPAASRAMSQLLNDVSKDENK